MVNPIKFGLSFTLEKLQLDFFPFKNIGTRNLHVTIIFCSYMEIETNFGGTILITSTILHASFHLYFAPFRI